MERRYVSRAGVGVAERSRRSLWGSILRFRSVPRMNTQVSAQPIDRQRARSTVCVLPMADYALHKTRDDQDTKAHRRSTYVRRS